LNQPNVEAAINYALHRLSVELPPDMTYHCIEHTRDEVIPAAVEFARAAELSERETNLLRIAAAFHDLGFIERPDDHEICSARIAAQVLPAFAFDARSIEQVMSLVLVTRLPQSPRSYLEELMCDADLSGLGNENFSARSAALLQERRALGQTFSQVEWWQEQADFLARHHYWTEIARERRAAGKAINLLRLHQRLAQAVGEKSGAE
jgi:uncharacterized protein